MSNYKEEYQRWLDSPTLTEREWEELNAISEDEKEIENRFYAPLEFGTAGLRGTMKIGLHNMNVHVIRHATQAFADVIRAEGPEAMKKGIAIAHDSATDVAHRVIANGHSSVVGALCCHYVRVVMQHFGRNIASDSIGGNHSVEYGIVHLLHQFQHNHCPLTETG